MAVSRGIKPAERLLTYTSWMVVMGSLQAATILWSSEFWAGLMGIPCGISLGLFCRGLVDQHRRGRLRLYASLWEWARSRDDGSASPIHARRIQHYYRQIRRYQHASRLLAWSVLSLSLAFLLFALSLFFGTCPLFQPSAWFTTAAFGLAAAALSLMWAPLALAPALLGVAASLFLLLLSTGMP